MCRKFSFIAVALAAFTFGATVQSFAGTEMIDNSGAPQPRYDYVPAPVAPPAVVYYAPPPPVRVVVYPRYYRAYGYYGPRFVSRGYHRFARGGYGRSHHWR